MQGGAERQEQLHVIPPVVVASVLCRDGRVRRRHRFGKSRRR